MLIRLDAGRIVSVQFLYNYIPNNNYNMALKMKTSLIKNATDFHPRR